MRQIKIGEILALQEELDNLYSLIQAVCKHESVEYISDKDHIYPYRKCSICRQILLLPPEVWEKLKIENDVKKARETIKKYEESQENKKC